MFGVDGRWWTDGGDLIVEVFGGEGRSRQEDAETSSRPGWAQPRQRPSPFPVNHAVPYSRKCVVVRRNVPDAI